MSSVNVKVAPKVATVPTDGLALTEIKAGELYTLERTLQNTGYDDYGHSISPGVVWVEVADRYQRSLSVYNLSTERRELLYPVKTPLPLKPMAGRKGVVAMRAKLKEAMGRNLATFARFGAGFTLGADPECFVVDQHGGVIPAFTFLPGKDAAHKLPWESAGQHSAANCHPYWDGYQAEYNIKPYNCLAHLTDCIQGGLRSLYEKARAFNPNAQLSGRSVMPVPAESLANAEEKHVQLGCLPSENAYGDAGLPVLNGRDLPVRFAGFHLHFALNQAPYREAIPTYVKLMDKICGVMSVAALEGLEDDIRRRYYGLAGEYRTPKHGMEWRVLSSAVLWHPALVHLHFNVARAAIQIAQAGLGRLWAGSDEEACEVVNTLDVDRARALIQRNRDLYIGILKGHYFGGWSDGASQTLDKLIIPGIRQHIELNMTANWGLKGHTWQNHSNAVNCQFNDFAKRSLDKK